MSVNSQSHSPFTNNSIQSTSMMNHRHEIPFRYNEALVSSCVSSPLAQSLLEQREQDVEADLEDVLDQQQGLISGSSRDCLALFDQHTAHYQRPPLSYEENQFWESWINEASNDATEDIFFTLEKISPRIETFLRSVIFVHEHNSMMGKHKVSLNRFSDMLPHELPLMPASSDDASQFDSGALEDALDSLLPLQIEAEYFLRSKGNMPTFVPLEDDDTIMEFGKKIRRMQQQQQPNNIHNDKDISSYTNKFQSIRDSWWWIGGGHNHGNQHLQDQVDAPSGNTLSKHSSSHRKSKDDSFLVDKENELGGLEEREGSGDEEDENDNWGRYLNWATEDNPDGVPIVHPAIDQGLCGSCWAISATGTLEASISRNMAYIAYEEAFSSVTSSHNHKSKHDDLEDPTMFAVLAAQQIERQSIITADLSVQELVDCDTRYDQGCAGGNPLLAFYFLHRFGITSSKNYPYTGKMNSCKYSKVDEPIATVKSWGILTPDHENNMEKVLRYIGPVAVGLIGADPAFLAYEKGVFSSSKGGKCDLGQADHAMLIVGYGEESKKDGTVEKYWIARNSWGSGWGENGYVRMSRMGGKKGHRGVCGIARSPSVALGGMFTQDVELDKSGAYGSTLNGEIPPNDSGSSDPDKSTISRASSQVQSVIHRIRERLGFVQKGIMMSTMDGSENKNVNIMVPCAMMIAMLSISLLLVKTHRKRCRGRQRQSVQSQSSSEEESVITSWSTVGVYNGIHEDIRHGGFQEQSSSYNDGERTHLLENNNGTTYT